MLISTFKNSRNVSNGAKLRDLTLLERSEAVERLERLEPATKYVTAASLIVNRGCKRLR